MKKYGLKNQPWMSKDTQKMNQLSDNNSVTYCDIYDIKLFSRDRLGVLKLLEEKLASGTKKYWIATVNPEFVMEAEKDKEFKKILNKTSLNVIDGIGLVWARELLSTEYRILNIRKLLSAVWIGVRVLFGRYKDQVASGADLIVDLVKIAKKDNKKIFFLGGWNKRAEKTSKYFRIKYQIHNSKYSSGEPEIKNEEVIKQINEFEPDILFVAYGMKKQEYWINNNLNKLNIGLVMGVGRSFDYYSGDLKRSPKWVRRMGMEWLYSLIKEPKRLKRQLVLPKFVWKVLND